jgi:hypothetical protein
MTVDLTATGLQEHEHADMIRSKRLVEPMRGVEAAHEKRLKA